MKEGRHTNLPEWKQVHPLLGGTFFSQGECVCVYCTFHNYIPCVHVCTFAWMQSRQDCAHRPVILQDLQRRSLFHLDLQWQSVRGRRYSFHDQVRVRRRELLEVKWTIPTPRPSDVTVHKWMPPKHRQPNLPVKPGEAKSGFAVRLRMKKRENCTSTGACCSYLGIPPLQPDQRSIGLGAAARVVRSNLWPLLKGVKWEECAGMQLFYLTDYNYSVFAEKRSSSFSFVRLIS